MTPTEAGQYLWQIENYTATSNIKRVKLIGNHRDFDRDGSMQTKFIAYGKALQIIQQLAERVPELKAKGTINLVFSNRNTKGRYGTAWYYKKKIILYPKGQTEHTLLHELAHILEPIERRPNGRGWIRHGYKFKTMLVKLEREWKALNDTI